MASSERERERPSGRSAAPKEERPAEPAPRARRQDEPAAADGKRGSDGRGGREEAARGGGRHRHGEPEPEAAPRLERKAAEPSEPADSGGSSGGSGGERGEGRSRRHKDKEKKRKKVGGWVLGAGCWACPQQSTCYLGRACLQPTSLVPVPHPTAGPQAQEEGPQPGPLPRGTCSGGGARQQEAAA